MAITVRWLELAAVFCHPDALVLPAVATDTVRT